MRCEGAFFVGYRVMHFIVLNRGPNSLQSLPWIRNLQFHSSVGRFAKNILTTHKALPRPPD
jgi:hypothetical protein